MDAAQALNTIMNLLSGVSTTDAINNATNNENATQRRNVGDWLTQAHEQLREIREQFDARLAWAVWNGQQTIPDDIDNQRRALYTSLDNLQQVVRAMANWQQGNNNMVTATTSTTTNLTTTTGTNTGFWIAADTSNTNSNDASVDTANTPLETEQWPVEDNRSWWAIAMDFLGSWPTPDTSSTLTGTGVSVNNETSTSTSNNNEQVE